MRKCRLSVVGLLVLGLWLFSSLATAQDLILTAPPREKPAAGQKQYGPLAAYLTKLFGHKVKYVFPGNWLKYQRDMRNDKYDIIFDGPHFISWRILHLGNQAVVRLPGHLQFYLMVKKNDNKINNINDLVAKQFCGVPPPNLASLSIIAAFPNPVRQPVIKGIRGAGKAVFGAFMKGECEAAVLRTAYYKRFLTQAQRDKVKIVYSSPPYPNQGITVSKRVTPREIKLMQQALTVGDGVKATAPILKRFGGKAKHFIPANDAEFKGINNLLEGVIFGWE
ncbi:MAG: PhnD/SsuA/transferrin family substrate-binding protein [Gammaproteobacteria bacterium]